MSRPFPRVGAGATARECGTQRRSVAATLKSCVRSAVRGTLLSFVGGLGDDLMCTAVARELSERERRRVWIVSHWPELFTGNRDFSGVLSPGSTPEAIVTKLVGYDRRHFLRYEKWDAVRDVGVPPSEHLIAALCRQVGIRGRVSLRPYLFLAKRELESVSEYRGCIAIQSSGIGARYPIPNKWWPFDRFAQVSAALVGRHRVVQVGSLADPSIPCTTDLRGKTKVRELAAILANSRLFIGLVGGPMHLARAVDCPSVIIYGGREAPHQSGYACNVNLYTELPCSPCWAYSRCDVDRRCLTDIGVNDVLCAVDRALANDSRELSTETVEIS